MEPTADQRAQFGRELRRLREERGLKLRPVAEHLSRAVPDAKVSHQAVSAWERGEYAPRRRSIVEAVEDLLDADGKLWPLLGMDDEVGLPARVEQLEEMFAELRAENASQREMLAQILRRLDGRG